MNKKKYSALSNIGYLIGGMIRWQKALLPMLVIHVAIGAVSIFIMPYLVKLIIEHIELQKSIQEFSHILIWYAAAMLVIYLLDGFFTNQESWRFDFIRIGFIRELMKSAITMDYEKLERPEILDEYEKIRNITNNPWRSIRGLMSSSLKTGTLIVQIIASAVIICTLNPWLVLIMAGIIYVQSIPGERFKMRDKHEVWDQLGPQWRKLFNLNRLTSHFSYAKDIRLFGLKNLIFKKQLDVNAEVMEKYLHSRNLWVSCHAINHLFSLLQQVIMYGWLIYSVMYKAMSIADFSFYITVLSSFSLKTGEMMWELMNIKMQTEDVSDFRRFLDEAVPEQANASLSVQKLFENNAPFEFVFENVSFMYEGQQTFALKDLNLTVCGGERLAVVGLNGAGKSTMIKLMCRLYKPTEGRILLNGFDIQDFDKHEYFKLIAPVFQNVEKYAFPLSENVSMSAPDKTDRERALFCLEQAGLAEKLNSLPNGIDSELLKVLSEDGIDLSGGEAQKLAFARALYKDSPVVILDEPTAALDPLAEHNLYIAFNRLIGDKTAVYISHRLSSTRFCNRVAMFENGRLAELGSHEELMQKRGAYFSLFEIQAQYYRDEEVQNAR